MCRINCFYEAYQVFAKYKKINNDKGFLNVFEFLYQILSVIITITKLRLQHC